MILLPESILFLIWMLLNTVVISFFCVGLRAITDESKILHFLRKPFDNINDTEGVRLQNNIERIDKYYKDKMMSSDVVGSKVLELEAECRYESQKADKIYHKRVKLKKELLKPIIGCVTCFASFWGTILFWTLSLLLSSYSIELLVAWPIVCIGSAFMNQYLWNKIE